MVTLQFFRTGNQPLDTMGPFPWVRLDAASVQAGPDGAEVARYHGGVWVFDHRSAPKYVIHGSTCTLRFEGEGAHDSTTLGLLDQVEVMDGAVYTQPGRRLVARLDEEKKAWYAYGEKRFWSALVMERCAGPEES